MSLVTTMNNSATGTTAHANGQVSRNAQNLNWAVDWVPVKATDVKQSELRSLKSDSMFPNRIRFERTTIGNVYIGTGIQSAYQLPSREGIKLFAAVSSVARVSDSDDASVIWAFPCSASMTLRVPLLPTDVLSHADIYSVLQQLFGAFHATDESSSRVGLKNLLLGNLDPRTWA